MSAAPRPHKHVALDPWRGVAGGRHGVEVPGNDEPLAAAQIGPGHHVVADPLDAKVGDGAESLLDDVGQLCLVVALGRNGDEGGGPLDQVGHGGRGYWCLAGVTCGGTLSPLGTAHEYRGRP